MATDPRTAKDLAFGARHYATAVAEELLAQGVPVSSVHACGPYTEPENSFVDVEGGINFTDRFDELFGGNDCGLHWSGASGWCFYNNPGAYGDFLDGARWMGDGLLPEPRRVAAFLDTVRLNPAQAGSVERPYYRQEGRDFPALLERLASYVPAPASPNHPPGPRLIQAQATAYRNRVLASLAVRGVPDPMIELPLRASEFDALGLLLEYVEAVSSALGPGTFAAHLGQDLQARRGRGYESVHRHSTARAYATELHDRLDQARREQTGNGEEPS
ncbi:DUF6292 family protein [Streptomyces sp. NBC_00989]|uniref:DUF6292 family protein n=1 Tax=Streptomyces sp. NBC_00989 TaxID=2903705 RepID=UPI002F91B320|nr:DUF6292 family protein [Streptomyces sp. NBC_00989]